jgi:predicted dehydrogenase
MGWAHAIGVQAMIDAGLVDAAVTAVCDTDAAAAAGLAAATGADAVDGLDDLIGRCDVLWVCTPTATHAPIVERAAAAGRAVFCEKPLATDLAGAQSMEALAAGAGLPVQVGLVLRAAPVVRALRALLSSGELGAPMAVVLRDDQYFPVQGLYRSTWRGDAALAGGGCLIEHSIHDVDLLRFCLGEVVEVAGRTATFAGVPGIEDLAVARLQFASGASAELVSVWHQVLSRGSTRRIEVLCQHGVAWLDNEYVGPLHVQTDIGVEVRPCPWPQWVADLPVGEGEVGLAVRSYVEPDRTFLDAVGTGATPAPSFAEAVAAHRLVDAIYCSARSGGTPVAL